jgi:hypothetical protein
VGKAGENLYRHGNIIGLQRGGEALGVGDGEYFVLIAMDEQDGATRVWGLGESLGANEDE